MLDHVTSPLAIVYSPPVRTTLVSNSAGSNTGAVRACSELATAITRQRCNKHHCLCTERMPQIMKAAGGSTSYSTSLLRKHGSHRSSIVMTHKHALHPGPARNSVWVGLGGALVLQQYSEGG